MWRPDRPETCVFCGKPIEADEPRVGRGESAAHTACADSALRDDRYWDAVSASGLGSGAAGGGETPGAGTPDAGTPRAGTPGAARSGRLGCAALVLPLLLLARVAHSNGRHSRR